MLLMDEYSHRCLAIYVARRIRSKEALQVFAELMLRYGTPEHIRSDNGPEMVVGRKNSIGVDMQPIHTHDAPVPGG